MTRPIKLVMLGTSTVGKTSIVNRVVRDRFNIHEHYTIGAAYNQLQLPKQNVEIWDTAGQERYLSLAPMYYRKANIVLLVYDLSNSSSVERLSYYLDMIYEHGTQPHCIIVGNKYDLVNDPENTLYYRTKSRIEALYSSCKLDFISVSAKSGYNIGTLKLKIQELADLVTDEFTMDISDVDTPMYNTRRCCQT